MVFFFIKRLFCFSCVISNILGFPEKKNCTRDEAENMTFRVTSFLAKLQFWHHWPSLVKEGFNFCPPAVWLPSKLSFSVRLIPPHRAPCLSFRHSVVCVGGGDPWISRPEWVTRTTQSWWLRWGENWSSCSQKEQNFCILSLRMIKNSAPHWLQLPWGIWNMADVVWQPVVMAILNMAPQ